MTYVEATNSEFVALLKGLEDVRNVKGTRFAFIVSKNIKELTNHLRHIEEMAKPSPQFLEVSRKALEFAEAGNENGVKELEAAHPELIEERKQQIDKLTEMLNSTASVALEFLREDQLPEDLTTDQLLPLLSLVKE